MTTIISEIDLSVYTPSEEYSQYIETNYVAPGKLVIERTTNSVTGHNISVLKFSTNEARAEYKADPKVIAELKLIPGTAVKSSIYQMYNEPFTPKS